MSITLKGGITLPRPKKWRKVCATPRCSHFTPSEHDGEIVEMMIDEYECIRLIDLEGLTQEQCADKMEISRTTAQAIYRNARKKLADCVVNGRVLTIRGGDYRTCENESPHCGCECCHKHHNGNPNNFGNEVDKNE